MVVALWWSWVPELKKVYEIPSKGLDHLLGSGNEKKAGSS